MFTTSKISAEIIRGLVLTAALCLLLISSATRTDAAVPPALEVETNVSYSTLLGGSGGDCDFAECAMTVDAQGNIYVAGETATNPDDPFPTLNPTFGNCGGEPGTTTTGCSGDDLFLTKFNADGTLAFSTYFGHDGPAEDITSIAVDDQGQIYVSGDGIFTLESERPTGFPLVGGEPCLGEPFCGTVDAFMAKFSSTGDLLFSTFISGSDRDEDTTLTVDADRNVYVVGQTESSDFPTTNGAFQTTLNGDQDAFLIKYDSSGTVVYSTLLGGTGDETASDVAVDAAGRVHMTGTTGSTDFPVQNPLLDCDPACAGFVTKFNPQASVLEFSTHLYSSGFGSTGQAYTVDVDSEGNMYVGGEGLVIFGDGYVTKIAADGSEFVYQTGLEETGFVNHLVVDESGRVYAGGVHEDDSTYLAVLDSNGTQIGDLIFIGGFDTEENLTGLARDGTGNIYLAGSTADSNFPTTSNAIQTSLNNGSRDVYVTKLAVAIFDETYLPIIQNDDSPGG